MGSGEIRTPKLFCINAFKILVSGFVGDRGDSSLQTGCVGGGQVGRACLEWPGHGLHRGCRTGLGDQSPHRMAPLSTQLPGINHVCGSYQIEQYEVANI